MRRRLELPMVVEVLLGDGVCAPKCGSVGSTSGRPGVVSGWTVGAVVLLRPVGSVVLRPEC